MPVDATAQAPAGTVTALRAAGARFAFLHGSRATADERENSDVDVAAWWGSETPDAWDVRVPAGVDLVILDEAPPWLAGRVALHGVVLFDDEPPARVEWQAETRLRHLDEEAQRAESRAEFIRAVARGR